MGGHLSEFRKVLWYFSFWFRGWVGHFADFRKSSICSVLKSTDPPPSRACSPRLQAPPMDPAGGCVPDPCRTSLGSASATLVGPLYHPRTARFAHKKLRGFCFYLCNPFGRYALNRGMTLHDTRTPAHCTKCLHKYILHKHALCTVYTHAHVHSTH